MENEIVKKSRSIDETCYQDMENIAINHIQNSSKSMFKVDFTLPYVDGNYRQKLKQFRDMEEILASENKFVKKLILGNQYEENIAKMEKLIFDYEGVLLGKSKIQIDESPAMSSPQTDMKSTYDIDELPM